MNPASAPDQLSDDGRLKHLAVYGALATAASVAIIALGERPNPFLLVLGVAVTCFGAGYVLSRLLRPEAKIIALTKRENRRFLIIQSMSFPGKDRIFTSGLLQRLNESLNAVFPLPKLQLQFCLAIVGRGEESKKEAHH